MNTLNKKVVSAFFILFFILVIFCINQVRAEDLPFSGLPLLIEEETEEEEEEEIDAEVIEEEYSEPETKKECIDYDQGKNYYEKGKAEIRELDVENPLIETEYDICNEDGSLKEWYCEENEEGIFMYGEIFECPNGCQNGTCITINKTNSNNYALNNNLVGKLLLQVEDRGRIWYIDFDGNKHEVTFDNALNLFETLAVGITNNDLYQIPISYDSWNSYLGNSLKGKLLLQVEDRGRIWYIDFDGKRHEVTWDNLMTLFESLSLGITNENLNKIGTYNDYDSDGLTDYDELNFYKTNPYNFDTDGDGYSDGEEIVSGYNPLGEGLLSLEFMDTDQDGLTDYDELNFYKTNPYNFDTDGDGYSDGDEIANGYNPLGDSMKIYSSELLSSVVYGGASNDSFNSFYKQGSYIYAVGNTYSEGFGGQSILIVKLNKNDLSVVKRKVYGESGNENINSIYVDEEYIYIVGSSDVLGQGAKDGLLMKLDRDNLSVIDQIVYGGTQDESFNNLQIDGNSIYVVGYTESVGEGEKDALLVLFNKEDLTIVDKEVYGGTSLDYFNSVYVNNDHVYAVGSTQSLGIENTDLLEEEEYTGEELSALGIGNKDLLLVKFNRDLGIIERKVLGNSLDNFVQAIYGDEEYVYVAGQTKNITRDEPDALMGRFKIDDLDDYEFKAYGLDSSEDIFKDIYVDSEYIYAGGSTSSSGNRNLDAAVIRLLKTNFNTKKVKIFGANNNDSFNEIYSDGDYIYTCGQVKLENSNDSIFTKILSLEEGVSNTDPDNFVWEDSNLDFFDINLLSTDSEGLDLSMANISTTSLEYNILGSDSFLIDAEEEIEEELIYDVKIVTSTIEYNSFDITIEPSLEELTEENFIFRADEVEMEVVTSTFEGTTEGETTEEGTSEGFSTYNIVVLLEAGESLEFEEEVFYEILVVEWESEEEEEEEINESLILVNPILTSGYQDSSLTDSHLNISKYIVSSDNQDTCTDYACCSDSDCNDYNNNTIDTCINPYFDNAYCQNETIPPAIECLSDVDCNDGNSCTTDTCILDNHTCSHQEIFENINNDACCLSSVWSYEFVPWKLDNDCDLALQTNSALIIDELTEIINLSSDNPQTIILLQEFIYDENDNIDQGNKILIGKLEADNTYTSYNNYSGEGVLVLELVNLGNDLEEQILSINIEDLVKDIYLPSVDSNISSEVDYYIADDGATYYSLYKSNGSFMSPLEAFIEQNIAREVLDS